MTEKSSKPDLTPKQKFLRRGLPVALVAAAGAGYLGVKGVDALRDKAGEITAKDLHTYEMPLSQDDVILVNGAQYSGEQVGLSLSTGPDLSFTEGGELQIEGVTITTSDGTKIENAELTTNTLHLAYAVGEDSNTLTGIARNEINSGNVLDPNTHEPLANTNDNINRLTDAMVELNGGTTDIDAGQSVITPNILPSNF